MNTCLRKKPRIKRKPVTLIVGIIAKDGIVVASDSQTTWGTGKNWNVNKMTEVKHPYGRAIVAESGATITSAGMVQRLAELAAERKNIYDHTLAGLGEQAARHVREKLRTQNFDCSAEELNEIILKNDLDAELMVADYSLGSPQVFTIRLSIGLSNRCRGRFEAVGSGSDLATYLLTDLCTSEMESEDASVIAVHVVETVKRHDPYCGGPTKLGVIKAPTPELMAPWSPTDDFLHLLGGKYYTPPILISAEDVDELVKVVQEVEVNLSAKRGEITRELLKKNTTQKLYRMLARAGISRPVKEIPI